MKVTFQCVKYNYKYI